MNGVQHIRETFAALERQGRKALMPYFTLGFPTPAASLDVITALDRCGADLIELGVPFSDPLADGPTIQHSTQVALEQGMTVRKCLDLTAQARARGVRAPLMLMGYVNPIIAYGVDCYVQDAAAAGASGLIVPDLPAEEAGAVETACAAHGLALVYLVSPASTPERLAAAVTRSAGFLYLVSLTGVTGARDRLADGLAAFIARVRAAAGAAQPIPLAVGFGISTPDQARAAAALADGVIIGSALIQSAGASGDPAAAAAAYISQIRAALDS
jgi:tryptophan synthase alpha chain